MGLRYPIGLSKRERVGLWVLVLGLGWIILTGLIASAQGETVGGGMPAGVRSADGVVKVWGGNEILAGSTAPVFSARVGRPGVASGTMWYQVEVIANDKVVYAEAGMVVYLARRFGVSYPVQAALQPVSVVMNTPPVQLVPIANEDGLVVSLLNKNLTSGQVVRLTYSVMANNPEGVRLR